MENHKVLKKQVERAVLCDLIFILDLILLHVEAGFALNYAWKKALEKEDPLQMKSDLPLGENLQRLSSEFGIVAFRPWFGILKRLYQKGAPIRPVIQEFQAAVENRLDGQWKHYCETIHLKCNIIILLFFLPPTMLLLFGPILTLLIFE